MGRAQEAQENKLAGFAGIQEFAALRLGGKLAATIPPTLQHAGVGQDGRESTGHHVSCKPSTTPQESRLKIVKKAGVPASKSKPQGSCARDQWQQ